MSHSYSVQELAEHLGGTLRGDGAGRIIGVADVTEAGPAHAAFVSSPRYVERVQDSRAGVVVVPREFGPTPMPAILCEFIPGAVARLLGLFAHDGTAVAQGIHSTAVVDPSAEIAPDAALAPHVVIGAEARIGARSILHAGVSVGRGSTVGEDCELLPGVVVLHHCHIGSRVVIHPNSVIGGDGFGYYFEAGAHRKVPHIGGVIIEDDVEIGSCVCVDRSKFGHTRIGAGTKIDNQVQIAHNVQLGEHCILVSQTGLAGSVRAGQNCVFGARAGVLDNVAIGDRATIAAIGVVSKDVPAGTMVSGFPAQEHRAELQERAALRRLPDLVEQVKALAVRVQQLEAAAHHRA